MGCSAGGQHCPLWVAPSLLVPAAGVGHTQATLSLSVWLPSVLRARRQGPEVADCGFDLSYPELDPQAPAWGVLIPSAQSSPPAFCVRRER